MTPVAGTSPLRCLGKRFKKGKVALYTREEYKSWLCPVLDGI